MIVRAGLGALKGRLLEDETLPLRAYLAAWRGWRAYLRYEALGFEHLQGGPALIVGYHGRPIAWDLCILQIEVYERLGYLPHGIIHGGVEANPTMKWISDSLGFLTGDGPALSAAVARGEHILVTPGGTREGCRSARHRYQVDWGQRTGYLKLALRLGLPVVPVAARGVDDLYVGLNDGEAWGKRVGMPARLPFWLGVGPLGLWPLSPPFPVKVRQRIGAPIDLSAEGGDPADPEALARLHQRVVTAVQGLMEGG